MDDMRNGLLTGRPNVSPDAIIDRLFQKLHLMYGRAWLDLWVGAPLEEVKAEWGRALTGVEPEAMRLALDSMLTTGKEFPPKLPEFVSLCRQFRRVGAPHLTIADKRRPVAADGHFQSLRDIIRKAGARE